MYWTGLKRTLPNFAQGHPRLLDLVRKLESSIDEHQDVLGRIQAEFDRRKEPTALGGAVIAHLLWHINHCMMFYASIRLANLSSAFIMLRSIFENFISMAFILSDNDPENRLAQLFFDHSQATDKTQFYAWYRRAQRADGKKHNLRSVCRQIAPFAEQDLDYPADGKYVEVYERASIFIHPNSQWTGQWWKYDEKTQRHYLEYSVAIEHFERATNEALRLMDIWNNIGRGFYGAGGK
jgi:hypothetical protein